MSITEFMPGNLKLIFGDFLRSAHKMWLEVMGGVFLALAVMFLLGAVSAYRRNSELLTGWDFRNGFSVFGSGFFSILMLAFALHTFWKARKIR